MIRSSFATLSLSVLGAAAALVTLACATDETSPIDSNGSPAGGSGTTAGGSSAPLAGKTSDAGGSSAGGGNATGGVTAGTPAAAGAAAVGPKQPLCVTKATVQSPLIADFESYDGVVAPKDYRWIFGGATPGALGVHTGTYAFGDGSAEPMLALLAGHAGNYGLQVSVTGANKWGQGFGMFFMDVSYGPGCIDASKYQGVSLWVRGAVPTGTFSFGVAMAQGTTTADGGTCAGTTDTCKSPNKADLPITTTWSQVNVLWADMTGGLAGDATTPLVANGDNITGFSLGANLTFVPKAEGSEVYIPVPGDIIVAIDDISFIP